MSQALIDQLRRDALCPLVTPSSLEGFLGAGASAVDGLAVLFFTGDPAQRPESGDVAVVLRELLARHPGRLRAAVVDRAEEGALKTRYGVAVVPSLVFLRDGAVAGIIPRIQDWDVYVRELARMMAEPSAAPNALT